MRPRERRRIRHTLCLIGAILTVYYLFFFVDRVSETDEHGRTISKQGTSSSHGGSSPHPPALLNNLSLTTSQCEAAFPGLTWSIDDVVSQGPFTLHTKGALVLGQIESGRLLILQAQRRRDLSAEMVNSRTASLHQVHRALLTAPPSEPIPDTIFSLNFQDQPFGTSWAYSRQADPFSRPGYDDGNTNARTFLMPHFSFWAWKLPFIGSMARAADAITKIETQAEADGMTLLADNPNSASFASLSPSSSTTTSSFLAKIPKAIWRGTTWFNSIHNPRLRANLLAAAKDKPWADVEALRWETGTNEQGERTAANSLPIEDFCRYRYVLHTEGVTYSGRFQFLQMCASVVLTPPIGWMQHTTHLVRPLFSSTLPGLEGRWTPSEMTRRSWPVSYRPEEANMVFVAPNWSDLEDTIAWLETHPDVAAGIARRQRETFVDGGYFSPAAEMCYWRALIRGWSKVVRVDEDELKEVGEGQTFEAFSLTNGD